MAISFYPKIQKIVSIIISFISYIVYIAYLIFLLFKELDIWFDNFCIVLDVFGVRLWNDLDDFEMTPYWPLYKSGWLI